MGRAFDSFLPTLKPLAANQITWDTENSLSQGCGPPMAHAPAPGRACTPHTSYSVRVRGYAVIIYLTVTYKQEPPHPHYKRHTCKHVNVSLFFLPTEIKVILLMHHFLNYRQFSTMGGQIIEINND